MRVITRGRRRTEIIVVSIFLVLLWSASTLSFGRASFTSNEWPMFRHDVNHSGYTANNVTANTYKTLWLSMTGAGVWSSPAVAYGMVFLGAMDGNVYSFNAFTGAKLWSTQTGSPIEYSSPAIANGVVYIGLHDGNVLSLKASTGEIVWKTQVGGLVRTSPTVVENRVYVGSWDHNVYSLDATNGAIIWSFPTENQIDSSPAVVDGVVFVGSDDDYIYALNASTGAKIWSHRTDGTITSSPSINNGHLYVGSSDGNVYGLNASTGAQIWKYQTGNPVVSSPAVAYGSVYVGSEDNNVYSLNATTGEKIWSTPTGFWVWSSPTVANGLLYIGSDDQNIYCLNALTGAKIWNYQTISAVDSSPVIAYGNLYAASDYLIYALGDPSIASYPPLPTPAPSTNTITFNLLGTSVAGIIILTVALLARSAILSRLRTKEAKGSTFNFRTWASTHPDAINVISILAFSAIFIAFLEKGSLWIADEQTYTQWAFHMTKSGDYMTPWAFGGQAIWIGKPPLTIWLMSLAYQVFGVNNFATRLWSPVFATLSCILVYYLGKRLYDRQVGLLSVVVLGTFITFFMFARHAMMDIQLVFFMTASIYFLLSSEKGKNANWFAALSGIFFGLALMTKQAEALLIPVIAFVYLAVTQKSLRFLFTKRFTLFWGVGLVLFSPWLIYMNAHFGSEFWQAYFLYGTVMRTMGPLEGHTGGYLYYFTYLVTKENPVWTTILPFAAGLCVYNSVVKRLKEDTLLLVWITVVLLVFSIAQTKLYWYILPAMPAFAIAIINFLYKAFKKNGFWRITRTKSKLAN